MRATYTVDVYRDRRGKYRWRFRAPNGNVMADSGQGYARRSQARAAFRRMRELLDWTTMTTPF